MDQLKLVWELENHNDCIDECRKDLTELMNSVRLDKLTNKVRDLESRTSINKEKIIDNDKQVSKLERLLKEYDYTSSKIEKDLYNGSVTDLKQLEHLTKEKDSILEKIDNIELNILEKMEENDDLQNDSLHFEDELEELKLKIIEIKDLIGSQIDRLKSLIYDAEMEVSSIVPNIDIGILSRYEKIRINKGKGIVLVNKNVCSGCNMRIPTFLMKDLKNGEEIVYCESCGRILYLLEDLEEEE